MKTALLIQLLQAADPSGTHEACVNNEDIFVVGQEFACWDGAHEVLIRDESRNGYNVIGAEIRCSGPHKVQIRTLSIESALMEDPELPVECPESHAARVEGWRREAREVEREIAEEKGSKR